MNICCGIHRPRSIARAIGRWGLASVLLTGPAFAQDTIARTFAVGPGAGQLGRAQRGEGSESDGPQSITAGRGGHIYLLDQANRRILAFDPKNSAGPAQMLALPAGISPTDMIEADGRVIVWDGKPSVLEAKGHALIRSAILSRKAAADAAVLSMLGQNGAHDPSRAGRPAGSGVTPVGAKVSESPSGPIKKTVATLGAGPVQAGLTPDARRTAMDIVVSASATATSLSVHSA